MTKHASQTPPPQVKRAESVASPLLSPVESSDGLSLARELIAHGIPVVVCTPPGWYPPGSPGGDRELNWPPGWQTITADQCDLSAYRPGVDVLAMVAGHGLDVIDVDSKEPTCGSVDHLPPGLRVYGKHRTPSDGWHLFVASTGYGKVPGFSTNLGPIGDYLGGTPEGGGRALAYLPGSSRPKYPGKSYTVVEPIDLDAALEDEPDDHVIDLLIADGARNIGRPGKRAATAAQMRAFLAEHRERRGPVCSFGKTTLAELLNTAPAKKGGRHGWCVHACLRLVELVRDGCLTSSAFDAVAGKLAEIKPEGGTDARAVLAYAIANADGSSGCGLHTGPPPDPLEGILYAAGDAPAPAVAAGPVARLSVVQVHQVFTRWLGDDYDLQALDVVLAAAAVEQLDGDPVWLLVISGPGNAKTETVGALAGIGAFITSTISSEGALLSATARKERSKDATGGLLRKLGDRGLLVVKDVTSILSMGRELRAAVLAALREVYDGRWERNVGSEGGRTLTWVGRLVVIGAVTTEWDNHHTVIAAMGDRFALVRIDSNQGRDSSGRQALANVGHETDMRTELAAAVAGLFAGFDAAAGVLRDDDMDQLFRLADLVTLARTAVMRDYRGEPMEAHMPEAPTRFAKMLAQVVRGARALGMDEDVALELAARVAADSIPPMRKRLLQHLLDVAPIPESVTGAVTALQVPRTTLDRTLRELHLIGLVRRVEGPDTPWSYRLSDRVDVETLESLNLGKP